MVTFYVAEVKQVGIDDIVVMSGLTERWSQDGRLALMGEIGIGTGGTMYS